MNPAPATPAALAARLPDAGCRHRALVAGGRGTMAGLSLVELLLAMAIGSILMLGLVQVFAASRATYQGSQALGRVQENARFALDAMMRDIRMAGHFGCSSDQLLRVLGDDPGAPTSSDHLRSHFSAPVAGGTLDFQRSITGHEASGTQPGATLDLSTHAGTWSPALPAAISALGPSPGSDIIALRFLDEDGVVVESLDAGPTLNTRIGFDAAASDMLDGNLFALSDCANVDVFARDSDSLVVSGASLDSATGMVVEANRYSTSMGSASTSVATRLHAARSVVYYVAPSANVASRRSLWRGVGMRNGAYVAQELAEGVESLQLLYGRDRVAQITPSTPPSGQIEGLDPAGTLAMDHNEWLRVGLVRMGLLVASVERAGMPPASPAPQVLGVRFAQADGVGDGRLRATYEVAVTLRNRIYGD